MSDFYVYIVQYNTGVPVYVGMGRGRRANRKDNRNAKINALIDFGGTRSAVKVREGLMQAEAHDLERALIAFHGRDDLGLGPLLNLCDGGAGTPGHITSPETLTKLSKPKSPGHAEKMRIVNIGRKHTEKSRSNMGASRLGRKASPEHVANLSAAWIPERRTAHAARIRALHESGRYGSEL